MPYLLYLCLITYSGVQYILFCVFAWYFSVLCLWIVSSVFSNVYVNFIVNSLFNFCLTPLFSDIFMSRTILQAIQFPTSYALDTFVFSELRRDVVVRIVDIDGIVFLQLFKLSFHNTYM